MRIKLMAAPLTLGFLLVLAACAAAPAAPSAESAAQPSAATRVTSGQPPRNFCQAQPAQFLVGQAFDDRTLAQALAAAGADEARMLRPDSVVTKEYQVGRLNVVVEADNRIVRVHCG
jgi:hypothetical protein